MNKINNDTEDNSSQPTNTLGFTEKASQEIGMRLRQGREKKRMQCEAIAQKIKVRERYLEAIEDGRWDVLPSGVNGRGLIRIYARELNVAIPEFEQFFNSSSQSPASITSDTLQKKSPKPIDDEVRVIPRHEYIKNQTSKNITAKYSPIPATPAPIYSEDKIPKSSFSNDEIVTPNLNHILGFEEQNPQNHVEESEENSSSTPFDDLSASLRHHDLETTSSDLTTIHKHNLTELENLEAKEKEVIKPQENSFVLKDKPQPFSQKKKENVIPLSNKEQESKNSYKKSNEKVSEKVKENLVEKKTESSNASPVATPKGVDTVPEQNSKSLNPSILLSSLMKKGWKFWGAVAISFLFLAIMFHNIWNENQEETLMTVEEEKTQTPTTEPTTEASGAEKPLSPLGMEQESITTDVPQESQDPLAGMTPETVTKAEAVAPTAAQIPITAEATSAALTVLENVDVQVMLDGKLSLSGNKNPGEYKLDFKHKADIFISDGANVKLKFGKWDYGTLGYKGRKRKITLWANSYTP